MNRRDLLKTAGLAVPASLLPAYPIVAEEGPKYTNDVTENGQHHTYKWINDIGNERPKYVWENREDVIYHELYYPDEQIQTAPEFYALMRCAWVFNKNMRWEHNNDTLVAHGLPQSNLLTGTKSVSAWFTDPANILSQGTDTIVFEKKSTLRKRDAVVLPALQFHIGQHPVLQLDVVQADAPWQLVVSRKGRSGPPLLSTGWQKGSASLTLDLEGQLSKLNLKNAFAELHFAFGVWTDTPQTTAKIEFKAELLYTPALVACMPVIRRNTDFPIAAFAPGNGTITATVSNQNLILNRKGNYVYGTIPATYANTEVLLTDSTGGLKQARVRLRKPAYTQFARYNAQLNAIELEGLVQKPLQGSYQGNMFFKDAGLPSEQLLNSQTEWNQNDRTEMPGEHQHAWESLKPEELHQRFAYLKKQGWDLVHLHMHYGIWERLDAVGNVCPHGFEQFVTYIEAAEKNGLRVMFTLSSYPYGVYSKDWDGGTTPYAQYLDLGFKSADWYSCTNEIFENTYARYITDVVTLLKEDTAIFSISSSGEGDWKGGPKRNAKTFETVKKVDTNHLTVSEPLMTPTYFPDKTVAPFKTDLVGDRNYGLGQKTRIDTDTSIWLRLNNTVPNMYIAECNFPASNNYCNMVHKKGSDAYQGFIGTPYYRNLIRDTLYMGLVRAQPLIMSWDEYFTEDEHALLAEARKSLNWNLKPATPPIALCVAEKLLDWDFRPQLEAVDQFLTGYAIEYTLVRSKSEVKKDQIFIDFGKVEDVAFLKKLELILKKLQGKLPLTLSGPYGVQYLAFEGSTQLVAYFYNRSAFVNMESYIHPNRHRQPVASLFSSKLIGKYAFKSGTWYDLTNKTKVTTGSSLEVPTTQSDYLLVVS